MTDETTTETSPADDEQVATTNSWEFIERPPTTEQVRDLLLHLPDTFGVAYSEFIDYVQPLPQGKKIKVPHPERPNIQIDRKVDVWSLYMSVAGRVKMLEAAAALHHWRVDFEPEPNTPTGIPGMLQYDDRIVYREYVTIAAPIGALRVVDESNGKTSVAGYQPLGRKPGTAWVPASGGRQAAGSNPFEKVETSARGRAIAAWGIGVLPGSGVASLEEMQSLSDPARRQPPGGDQPQGQRSKEELLSQARMLLAQVRQAKGLTGQQAEEIAGQRLAAMGVTSPYDEEAGEVDWAKPNTGQLTLLIEDLKQALRTAEGENLMEQGL